MSSNISDRERLDPPPELPEPAVVDVLLPVEPDWLVELLPEVEYLLDPDDEESVFTSVPKSVHSSQSSSSAPSTFVVVSDDPSAPHISHCAIPPRYM
jgi:hypothetical protein